jgi:hypothetical protein
MYDLTERSLTNHRRTPVVQVGRCCVRGWRWRTASAPAAGVCSLLPGISRSHRTHGELHCCRVSLCIEAGHGPWRFLWILVQCPVFYPCLVSAPTYNLVDQRPQHTACKDVVPHARAHTRCLGRTGEASCMEIELMHLGLGYQLCLSEMSCVKTKGSRCCYARGRWTNTYATFPFVSGLLYIFGFSSLTKYSILTQKTRIHSRNSHQDIY